MKESNHEELRIDEKSFDLSLKDILSMPKNTLEHLCDLLSISDQLQLARVCKLGHSLVFERHNPKAREPLSLIRLTEKRDFCGKRMQITCYQIHPKSFQHSNPYIIGSFKGWLFLLYSKEKLIQLVNLFSNIHLDLPPLVTMMPTPSDGHPMSFAVLFCSFLRPILAAFVSEYGELSLCKIGGSAWEAHQTDEKYVNVAFHKKKLYAMRENYNKVDIFEIDHDLKLHPVGGIEIDDTLKLFPLAVTGYSRSINAPKWGRPFQAYLVVESQEDHLYLVMHHREEVKVDFLTVEFEIYKVCGNRLVKVDTLGDQIVLLNGSCSEIIDVKDCPPSYFHGNQICFKENVKTRGIYSVKDGIVDWLPQFDGFDCIHWMIPSLAGKCHCESHIIHLS